MQCISRNNKIGMVINNGRYVASLGSVLNSYRTFTEGSLFGFISGVVSIWVGFSDISALSGESKNCNESREGFLCAHLPFSK